MYVHPCKMALLALTMILAHIVFFGFSSGIIFHITIRTSLQDSRNVAPKHSKSPTTTPPPIDVKEFEKEISSPPNDVKELSKGISSWRV